MLSQAASNEQINRFLRAINEHDIDKISSCFSENATMIDPFLPAPLTSKNSILEFWRGLFNSFPDMKHHVDDTVVNAGKGFVAFTTKGVGKGSLGRLNVDGKQVEIEEGYLLQLDDGGRITRLTIFLDTAKLSRQLGG